MSQIYVHLNLNWSTKGEASTATDASKLLVAEDIICNSSDVFLWAGGLFVLLVIGITLKLTVQSDTQFMNKGWRCGIFVVFNLPGAEEPIFSPNLPDFASSLDVSPAPKLNLDYKLFFISNSADGAVSWNNIIYNFLEVTISLSFR